MKSLFLYENIRTFWTSLLTGFCWKVYCWFNKFKPSKLGSDLVILLLFLLNSFSCNNFSRVEFLWKREFLFLTGESTAVSGLLWVSSVIRLSHGVLSGPIATAKDPPQTALEIFFLLSERIGCGYSLGLKSLRPSSPLEFWPHVHKRPCLSCAMPNDPPILISVMSASTMTFGSKNVPNTPVPQK